jgi:type IX secretion system PorP/SprF family membrane protein
MTRHLLTLLFAMLLTCSLRAQQDPIYSQHMYNQMAINPAYAGINDLVCLGIDYRQMWTGIEGGPNTISGNANAPIKPFGLPSGIGLIINNDVLGFQNNSSFNLAYSYKISIRNGKLGIGLGLGFANQKYDNLNWLAPDGSTGGTDIVPQEKENAAGFDLNLGTYYKTENLYMGFSVNHLLATRLDFGNAVYQPQRSYNILAGYRMQLSNPAFEVQPSAYLSSDGRSSQATLNTNLEYNKKIWGGVSYRLGDAFIGMLGMEIFNGVRVCYSYDFTTSDLRKSAQASHELTLAYCFNLKVDKTPQRYKSVRFL